MAVKPKYPDTTLFLNLSIDGRITSHDSDMLDPDKTWKNTPGIRSLLQQFYDFDQTNMAALTTGVLMKNIGVNTRAGHPQQEDLTLIVLDPDADLTVHGIDYLSKNVKRLILICLTSHPAAKKVPSITYPIEIDLNDAFTKLLQKYAVKKLFIHSIAPLNASLFDAGLVNHLTVLITPILVGDHGTPALPNSLNLNLRALKLVDSLTFAQNYISLRYDVT